MVDIMAGTHIAQGILAVLGQKKTVTGEAALVQVSMKESILDFQFEVLTCYYNHGRQLQLREAVNRRMPALKHLMVFIKQMMITLH